MNSGQFTTSCTNDETLALVQHLVDPEINFPPRKEDETYIYALTENGEIRYVGKADDPLDRWWEHLHPFYLDDQADTYKVRWLKKLLRQRQQPGILHLKTVPMNDWGFYEIWSILSHKLRGYRLTNGTTGGEGFYGVEFTDARREKMRVSMKKAWVLRKQGLRVLPKKKLSFLEAYANRKGRTFLEDRKKNATSKYPNIIRLQDTESKSFVSRFRNPLSKKREHLGCYTTEQGAASAYNRRAREVLGKFARLLNIEGGEVDEPRMSLANNHFGRTFENKTSKYLGVHKTSLPHGKPWKYAFSRNGKLFQKSGFATEEEAYAAYLIRVKEVEVAIGYTGALKAV